MCPVMPHRWLSVVFGCLLIVAPVWAVPEEISCSAYDFRPYWTSVLEAHLTEILSASEGTEKEVRGVVPDEFWQAARIKTNETALRFSTLLSVYPELCRLKYMTPNKQSRALFVTLVYQTEAVIHAFKRNQLSAKYLSGNAIIRPHFISNLLGHLSLLGDLTHALEININQLKYFLRLQDALVKGDEVSHTALLVYSQAFTHLLLLINEGQSDEFLDRYSRTVSNLKEDQFDAFLELDQLSTDGIDTFISELELVYQN